MNCLPENHKRPTLSSANYLKPQEGLSQFRILSNIITGWEDWSAEKKVFRFRVDNPPAKPLVAGKKVKYFWSMIVWNVLTEQIQIFNPTQLTIQDSLESFIKDSDWGLPINYDIKIVRKGEGVLTEYTVTPVPHKPLSQEILREFKNRPIQLEALYEGLDPFSTGYKSYTPLMGEVVEPKVQPINQLMGEPVEKMNVNPLYTETNLISYEQFSELDKLREGCSEKTQQGFDEYIKKAYNIESLAKLEGKFFEEVKSKLQVRFDENQKAKK